jgi:hypothetical protein
MTFTSWGVDMTEIADDLEPVVPNIGAEVAAIQAVAEAVKGLERDAVARVISYLAEAYKINLPNTQLAPAAQGQAVQQPVDLHVAASSTSSSQFGDLNDLYHAANPSNDVERALVVGYWLQVCEGQEDFDSQSVNSELKHLGYPVKNITSAFTRLQSKKPVLASQTRKSGTSKQARKKYKLTQAGMTAVERMCQGQGLSEE